MVARGVRYAVDNGAKVLNMSIGRTGPPAPVVQEAINYAVSRGAFVVVAAGNEFEEGNPVERLAEFAPQIDGHGGRWRDRPRPAARVLLDHRAVHRAGGARRQFASRRE